jgi:hypothetical protein
MIQRMNVASNSQLIIWMPADVVPPYAHGA